MERQLKLSRYTLHALPYQTAHTIEGLYLSHPMLLLLCLCAAYIINIILNYSYNAQIARDMIDH